MDKSNAPSYWRNSKARLRFAGKSIKGKIESFTVVYVAPSGFEHQVPYVLAIVSLENGEMITAQIVDAGKVEIGMNVESCLRRVFTNSSEGIINYGTKFRVLE